MKEYILQYYSVEQRADEMVFVVSPLLRFGRTEDRHGRIEVEMGDIIFSSPELIDRKARTTLLPRRKVEAGRQKTVEDCYKLILYFIFKDQEKI